MRLAFCAVALLALACLLVRAGRLGMAGDYIDPFSHIGAQDEALYAHSAIQMARHGGWLTPIFMGRYGLYKPPVLAAAAGLSARILGVSRLALRLPVALLASLAVGLVFWWVLELNGWQAAACGVLLLISDHLWHTLASICLTDGLLAAFYVAAVYCLFADPWLESKWAMWGYSGAVAAGILTKSVAGLMPLAVLGLYWIFAPRKYRPRFWRVVGAGALALVLAAPWFVYQLAVHGRWFWTEHIGVEILGFGAGAPPQTSQENQVMFYLTRAVLLDPVLLAVAAAAIPTFARELRRRSAPAVLLALALALPATAVLVWQYRNVSYLIPLVPMVAILATAYNPLCSGRAAKWMLALAAAVFVVKAAVPGATWGLPFRAGTRVAAAPLLSDYCERGRGNELILVDTPDEMYASLLPLPKVRYVLQGAAPAAGKYGLDFSSMGIILNAAQFDDLPKWMPGFREQLHEWGLESTDAVGTVVFVNSPAEVATVVAAHPDSDFLLPDRVAQQASGTREAIRVSPEYFLLLSRRAMPASAARWTCRL
jgi:Dolichyl-phosphate-mannose-protein mannosyltransferase